MADEKPKSNARKKREQQARRKKPATPKLSAEQHLSKLSDKKLDALTAPLMNERPMRDSAQAPPEPAQMSGEPGRPGREAATEWVNQDPATERRPDSRRGEVETRFLPPLSGSDSSSGEGNEPLITLLSEIKTILEAMQATLEDWDSDS